MVSLALLDLQIAQLFFQLTLPFVLTVT